MATLHRRLTFKQLCAIQRLVKCNSASLNLMHENLSLRSSKCSCNCTVTWLTPTRCLSTKNVTLTPNSQVETNGKTLNVHLPDPNDKHAFVPACRPVSDEDFKRLQEFVHKSKTLLVLTGAGISTESGIPDYRSEGVGLYATSDNRPILYQDFVKWADMRQRYWARNYVGWPRFGYFLPNSSHQALARWEDIGKVHWLVTQNVDALHYKAGSQRVTELHGSAHRVVCLDCDYTMTRPELQELILSQNPYWTATSEEMAPDADVQLSQEQVEGFVVPPCPGCGGRLKPEITFFGDNVNKSVVNFVHEKVRECDSILFAGTSLHVYSGYRFALAAKEQGKHIAILNIGPTRADKLALLKIEAKCGDTLPHIRIS